VTKDRTLLSKREYFYIMQISTLAARDTAKRFMCDQFADVIYAVV